MEMSWPGDRYGKARSSTVFTTLKIAVLAPMPRASVTRTIAVKAGVFARRRALYRMSRRRTSMARGSWVRGEDHYGGDPPWDLTGPYTETLRSPWSGLGTEPGR